MSATGPKNDELPLLSTVSELENCRSPLIRINKSFHHSAKSCSVSKPDEKNLTRPLLGCGFLQLLFGVFSFSLGLILSSSLALWQDAKINFPHWLGGLLFIGFGTVSMLAAKYPRPGLMFLHVLLNLAGLVTAVGTIVIYVTYLVTVDLWWSCGRSGWFPSYATESPYDAHLSENCYMGREMYLTVFRGISYMLIGFSSAQFQYSIRVIIPGIRIWRSFGTNRNQSPEAPGQHTPAKPALTKVTIISTDRPVVLFEPPQKNHGENGTPPKTDVS